MFFSGLTTNEKLEKLNFSENPRFLEVDVVEGADYKIVVVLCDDIDFIDFLPDLPL